MRKFLDRGLYALKIVLMDTKKRTRGAGLVVSEALAHYSPIADPGPDTEGLVIQQIGGRLREARGIRSRTDMAELLGVHENTIGKMERGESVPDAIQLLLYAHHTGRPVLWLLGQDAAADDVRRRNRSTVAVVVGDQVFVPLFAVSVSAGNGAFNDEEQVLDMRAFALDYVRSELRITHDQLALVNVVGNSMEPHIHSGDVVLVDRRDKEISVEGPHLVRVDGALLVKNVQRRPGGVLRVSSKNEEYEPFEINVMSEQLHDFEVLGRVRWAGVTFR